ncbi:hypothetical protein GGR54DRAFT_484076 [Hypoxylon sp. NC1633]|nr:hypothetical protein GGR54DRAFT_484076 [Hypoxylon sp. NC1633]
MAAITELPCEIVVLVLRNLGSVRFLLPSLLTCRHFYSSFKEHPNVAAHILQQQVTPALIPYSIAVLEASRLKPRTAVAVRELLETLYTEPSKLADRLRTMPIPLLARMGHMHDVIHSLATEFASRAWIHISKEPGSQVSSSLSLSLKEYFRFCRAFYRAELYLSINRNSMEPLDAASFRDSDKEWFTSKHPPWENEQLGCVQYFLELKFSEASRDVLAHDVVFGELGVDYLQPGGMNWNRQAWLSQGVDFIHRLMNEGSWDVKNELLKSKLGAEASDLFDRLSEPPEDFDGIIPLSEYTNEGLATLFPTPDSQDTNRGPYEAWRVGSLHLPRSAWVMLSNNSGLRERAYVFWDLERLERYGMLELFENVPEDNELDYTAEDYDDMIKSQGERSVIWQKGAEAIGAEVTKADSYSRFMQDHSLHKIS